MTSPPAKAEAIFLIAIPLILLAGMSVCVTGIWVCGQQLLQTESGLSFAVAIFVLAVDGIFVPAVIGYILITELLSQVPETSKKSGADSVSATPKSDSASGNSK